MIQRSAHLALAPEVKKALARRAPVVALESTLISHGMPYPQNLETARALEQIVRDHGAVPATIGILDGVIQIGLSAPQLERFARADGIEKVSRRDFPYVVGMKKSGATTVAGTLLAAQLAGIRIMVTGGIGGVHRNAEKTLDVSADLTELGQTDVAVICAGVKSILDIAKTLEYLETLGVPVLGYRTDRFPAFYTRDSGCPVDFRVETPAQAAAVIRAKWELCLHGSLVIANPIPEADQMDPRVIDHAIGEALEEADREGINGKRTTPFLLERIVARTNGKSLTTNIALVKNNAALGAQIAVAYAASEPSTRRQPAKNSRAKTRGARR